MANHSRQIANICANSESNLERPHRLRQSGCFKLQYPFSVQFDFFGVSFHPNGDRHRIADLKQIVILGQGFRENHHLDFARWVGKRQERKLAAIARRFIATRADDADHLERLAVRGTILHLHGQGHAFAVQSLKHVIQGMAREVEPDRLELLIQFLLTIPGPGFRQHRP